MQITKPAQIYLALTSVSFLWGTSFAAAKIGLMELDPLNLVILRFVVASLLFCGILALLRENNTIERRDVPQFVLLGFLAITSYFYIQFTGLKYTTTINAALIIATSPICTALIGGLLGWERVKALTGLGILVAFAGVTLIITRGQFSGLFHSATLTGDLLLLVNAVVWAGFTAYGKTILQKYRPFVAMAYIHIFGTLLLLPFAFFASPFAAVPLIEQIHSVTWPTLVSGLYLALLCSVYAYYIWYSGVEKLGAVKTAAFSYLNPLFAVITGVLLLNEQINGYLVAGGLLVIGGVYLANKATTSHHQPQPARRNS